MYPPGSPPNILDTSHAVRINLLSFNAPKPFLESEVLTLFIKFQVD